MSVSWPEISKTMKPTFNISANLTECYVADCDLNEPSNPIEMVPVIAMDHMVSRAHFRYKHYLTLDICSQVKRTAIEKLMSHTAMSE